jgi:hypothetical protein
MNTLVVTNQFGGYEKGERITDPAAIGKILAGEHAHDVVQSHHADAPVAMADAPELDETTTEEA